MNNFEKSLQKNKQATMSSGKRLLKGIGDNKKSVRRVCVEDYLPTTPWTLASKVSFRVSSEQNLSFQSTTFLPQITCIFSFLILFFYSYICVFWESHPNKLNSSNLVSESVSGNTNLNGIICTHLGWNLEFSVNVTSLFLPLYLPDTQTKIFALSSGLSLQSVSFCLHVSLTLTTNIQDCSVVKQIAF